MPRRSTLGEGSSSCLKRAWAIRSAICSMWSEWELRKAGPPMTLSMGMSFVRSPSSHASYMPLAKGHPIRLPRLRSLGQRLDR